MSSIFCDVDSKSETLNQTATGNHSVHFVPAKINYNGLERVDPYFTDFIKQNDNGTFSTALRGRPLTGKKYLSFVRFMTLGDIDLGQNSK
jgi:hypothetical protein